MVESKDVAASPFTSPRRGEVKRIGVFPEPAMDKSLRQSVVIALLVAGALFMEQLDGTVIATALPQMAQSFRVAAVDLNIGMSAYLLTVAVFIPASGWVTDCFEARTVFASAIVTFTLASVLCAASGTLWQFTVARVLQGIGGAMMVPVGRLIVLRNTEKQHFVRMIAEAEALDAGQDVISSLSPAEGFGVCIGCLDVSFDRPFEISDRAEHASPQGRLRQQREEAFDLVDP
jgi:MFS transporter